MRPGSDVVQSRQVKQMENLLSGTGSSKSSLISINNIVNDSPSIIPYKDSEQASYFLSLFLFCSI
jgi:hypothetical protein